MVPALFTRFFAIPRGDMEYTFTFTQQEAQLIINALGELPIRVAGILYAKIGAEIQRIESQAKEQ